MQLKDLILNFGDPMQIHIVGDDQKTHRLGVKLIGYLPSGSVIVSVPFIKKGVPRLRGGMRIMVNAMFKNGYASFSSRVETIASQPYPHLHLSYPASVKLKTIRNSSRVDIDDAIIAVNLDALGEESQSIAGRLLDASSSGAKIALKDELGKVGDEVALDWKIQVENVKKSLSVQAVIRAKVEQVVDEHHGEYPHVYGVEFTEKDEDKLMCLYAFVYSHLQNEQEGG